MRKTLRGVSICGILPAFLLLFASCTVHFEKDSPFKKMFEENVLWADEEGKLTVNVQGPCCDSGFARLLVNGEEKKATATFSSDNWSGVGMHFKLEESILGLSHGFFRLEFKEAKADDSAVFTVKWSDGVEDPYFKDGSLITLSKRPLLENEFLDAKYCVLDRWWAQDIEAEIRNVDETPYTGKAVFTYETVEMEFFYLEDGQFKIMNDEEKVAEGKYSFEIDRITLTFDVYGSNVFGENMTLLDASAIQKNKVSD